MGNKWDECNSFVRTTRKVLGLASSVFLSKVCANFCFAILFGILSCFWSTPANNCTNLSFSSLGARKRDVFFSEGQMLYFGSKLVEVGVEVL